ncbi:hypothetical protein JCM19296_51 [Nonlabens ulvanivorans]|uniref:Fido domain-containing protein n=1 Tax=Nonlabens ulvanivorans TaxID=906888 RepID=A0A081D6C7_NONUL|nr:hypothetical protein JCM19296_51 [Nonlabens ulvanivorans]
MPTTKWVRVGKYKTESNSVRTRTGKVFRFTEPGDVIAEMDQLIQWYREEKEKDNYNSLLTAAEFHYRFIIIHPFDDGNGRTARILMNFILMKDGFPPIIIPTEEKPTYLNALEQGDTGNFEPFYTYLSDKLIVSLSLMISGAKGEKISDDNDMSKKLAVLKNKLASIPQKHKMIPRKSGRVARVLEEGMLPALKMVQNFHVGMKEYFVSAMIETEHNNETVGPQVAPLDFEAIFYNIDKKSVSRFGAVYYLQTLEKALPAKVSYRYSVYVEFKKDEYRLFFQSDGANYSIMGFYGDKVDVADIKDKTNKMLDSVIQGIDKSLES